MGQIRLPRTTIIYFLVTLLASTNFGCNSREPVEKEKQYKWLPEEENYTSVAMDGNQFFVFDHVEAVIEKHAENGVNLKITNPTKFDATVSLFAESAEQAQSPLGYTAFMNWPKVKIKANDTLQIHISSNGCIIK